MCPDQRNLPASGSKFTWEQDLPCAPRGSELGSWASVLGSHFPSLSCQLWASFHFPGPQLPTCKGESWCYPHMAATDIKSVIQVFGIVLVIEKKKAQELSPLICVWLLGVSNITCPSQVDTTIYRNRTPNDSITSVRLSPPAHTQSGDRKEN